MFWLAWRPWPVSGPWSRLSTRTMRRRRPITPPIPYSAHLPVRPTSVQVCLRHLWGSSSWAIGLRPMALRRVSLPVTCVNVGPSAVHPYRHFSQSSTSPTFHNFLSGIDLAFAERILFACGHKSFFPVGGMSCVPVFRISGSWADSQYL